MIKSRYKPTRRVLLFWTLFIGIGAVAGAVGMFVDPSGKTMGMDAMLPFFEKLPLADILFRNLLFPGIALLIVNGLTNLAAAALIILNKRAGLVLGGVFGVTLMLWICIQFYMFPFNFMSTSYFVFGLVQAITGYMACVFYDQEKFAEGETGRKYPNIGRNPRKLVVYFSRMGYTRKIALEEAERTGADVYEIKSTERTEGTLGFWWCGRYGMHKWEMPTEPISAELEKYDEVTICTPIWVFALASPTRAFCRAANGRIKSAEYILVHHEKSFYKNASDEMDELLGLRNTPVKSLCCRRGKIIKEIKRSD